MAGFLGKWPHEVDELPASEFQRLFIAEQLSPFGDRRADIQCGIIASTMANMFRAYIAGQARKPFTPMGVEEFMLPSMPKDPGPRQDIKAAEIQRQYEFMLAIQHIQNTVVAKDDPN